MGAIGSLNENNTTTAQEVSRKNELPAQPLLPGSLTWRDFGSILSHLMLPQAFTLQTAFPMIDLAVGIDKKYKYDPYGRAKNSTELLWPVVYSRPEKGVEMGIQLRELHRKIKGVSKDGKQYHALDPQAYSWVHMTGFDASVRAHDFFGTPLNKADRARMFDEWKTFGRLLGVSERYIPETEAQYWEYFNSVIEEKLVVGEVLQELLDPKLMMNVPKPPQAQGLPTFLWKALLAVAGKIQYSLTVATLPERARIKFKLEQNASDKFIFSGIVFFMKHIYPRLPERARYIPLAWKAIQDSRKHPEAYQYNAEKHFAELSKKAEPVNADAQQCPHMQLANS